MFMIVNIFSSLVKINKENKEDVNKNSKYISIVALVRPSPRPRGSARRKTASSLILRGHF